MRLVKTDKAYKLGIQLGVDEHSLKIAQRNHLNDHAALLMEVLDLYLKQIVPASWVDVATALDVIGERKNANDIAKEFGMASEHQQIVIIVHDLLFLTFRVFYTRCG